MQSLKLHERTIPNVLNLAVDKHRKRTFILYEDQKITYGEFDDVTNRIGNSLISAGIEKGSKVSILMGNKPEFLETWIGLAKIGAIEVPIEPELRGDMLLHRLRHSESRILIVEDRFLASVAGIEQSLEDIRDIFVYPKPPSNFALKGLSSIRPFSDLLRGSRDDPTVETKPEDLHAIIYTSGSTGPAKGVMVPHAQWTYVAQCKNEICETTPDDIIFNCYPLYNATGQCETSFSALMAGAAVSIVDRFSASRFWGHIRKFGATQFVYMGGILTILLKQPASSTDMDHRCRLAWGCASGKSVWEAFENRFGIKIIEIYGLTEAWPITQYPRGAPRSKIGSIGKVVDAFDARIFDENDTELPAGKIGEIVIRPRAPFATCAGYYKDAETTIGTTRNLWWHTGDLGYRDEDGYFYFVERKKDLMRIRGRMISPWEIEQALNKNPKILESVAVGVKSDLTEAEDECKVVICLKSGEEMTPIEVLGHCEKYLPKYMIPRYIEFVQGFEKTATMRIQRWRYRQLRIGNSWDGDKARY